MQLGKDLPIDQNDEQSLKTALFDRADAATDGDNVFLKLLVINELLQQAVNLRTAKTSLEELQTFQPQNLENWSADGPTFFEGRLLRMLCYRNFVWPDIAEKNDAINADKSKANKLLMSAMGTALFGKMDLPELGKVDLDKARKHKIQSLQAEANDMIMRGYKAAMQGVFDSGDASKLSVISANNNAAGNMLTAFVYAKAAAMNERMETLSTETLSKALELVKQEQVLMEGLADSAFSMIDSGLASPRLFNRLLGEAIKSIK